MTPRPTETALSLVDDLVAIHLGLDFSRRRSDLERGVRAALQEEEHGDMDRYFQKLLSGGPESSELERLASHLTVGETYFFRDRRALNILAERILPELAKMLPSGNEVTIWSAGCSTGEEPYSIAMQLDRTGARLRDRNIKIFGTDINTSALEKASQGIYGEWSFRDAPYWVKSTYFQEALEERWSVLPRIKAAVTFSRLNLMDDSYLSLLSGTNGADVVFCRNVLMYFTPDAMREAVDRLHRSLAPHGWLVVSPAETSRELFSDFVAVNFDGATLYRKCSTLQVVVPDGICRDKGVDAFCPELTPASMQAATSADADLDLAGDMQAESFEPAEPSHPKDQHAPGAMLHLGRASANEGKLAEAIDWCEKAIAADKMAAAAHYLKATILQERGLLQEATLSLRRAIYAEPRFVLGHFALANLAMRQGKLKESQKHFENVWLLLAQYKAEDIVPESDGLSVGMLREMLPPQNARGPNEPGIYH